MPGRIPSANNLHSNAIVSICFGDYVSTIKKLRWDRMYNIIVHEVKIGVEDSRSKLHEIRESELPLGFFCCWEDLFNFGKMGNILLKESARDSEFF